MIIGAGLTTATTMTYVALEMCLASVGQIPIAIGIPLGTGGDTCAIGALGRPILIGARLTALTAVSLVATSIDFASGGVVSITICEVADAFHQNAGAASTCLGPIS